MNDRQTNVEEKTAGTYVRHLESKVDQRTCIGHIVAADTYAYIFLSKLLVQTLREGTQREFGRRKCRRSHIPAQCSRHAGEEQRAALAVLVEQLALERSDPLLRERKCSFDIRFQDMVDFYFCDLQ